MRLSQYYIPTLKEAPKDADTLSAKLMLRAGLIRKTSSGIYEWLPLGLRVLKKVEQIVREEMDRACGCEVWLPVVQPKELWQESGRWTFYGKELLRFEDRKGAEFCLAPTAEEVITATVRRDVTSYKQLPVFLYQFGTKFRDEIRPRFGVMRAREFYMKDGYSFHATEECANKTYQAAYDAYNRIFERCGFKFKPVEADTGSIGGNFSHEFMVLADTGENEIAHCTCGYAANTEKAEIIAASEGAKEDFKAIEKVSTPNATTIDDVSKMMGEHADKFIKLLVFIADKQPVIVLMKGNDELNEHKLRSLLKAQELEKANEEVYSKTTGSPVGFAGPQNIKGVKIYADNAVKNIFNGVAGANEKDAHVKNVNLGRDYNVDIFADLKIAVKGDKCAKCGAEFMFTRGIEVGHTFKLGTKYSTAMKATFLDEQQKANPFIMGCYGIGISRVVAAAIEQSHDDNGIIWPEPIAPFDICLVGIDDDINEEVKAKCEEVYKLAQDMGFSVLFDDRKERPGSKFKDADLCGIPNRIVISSRTVKEGQCEFKKRTDKEAVRWQLSEIKSNLETLKR